MRTDTIAGTTNLTVLDEPPPWLAWEMAVDAFLDAKERVGGSTHTRRAYESDLRLFFDWARVEPWQVTAAHAHEYARWLREEGRADATVNRRLAALSSFYQFVARRYQLQGRNGREVSLWPADRVNPFDAVERARVSPYGRAVFPTTQELNAILDAINAGSLHGKRDLALLYTIATTCLRASAVLHLRRGHLQRRDDGQWNLAYRYKGGDQRKAVLARDAFAYICDYLRADHRPWRGLVDEQFVFVAIHPDRVARLPGRGPGDPERPISNSFANRILKKYARRAGVDLSKAHLHALRHAGARLRAQQSRQRGGSVDLLELMHVLGHASVAVTQIYADRVLDDPEDTGLAAAAAALRPKHKRRAPPPEPDQDPLF